MTVSSSESCLNCGATEADRPMMMWHYQGRELWICAECLPLMIHKREQLMIKWPPPESHETSIPSASSGQALSGTERSGV